MRESEKEREKGEKKKLLLFFLLLLRQSFLLTANNATPSETTERYGSPVDAILSKSFLFIG